MINGEFEIEEREFVETLIPAHDTFVDIGANIGLYSLLANRLSSRVIAIEPEAHNQKFLYRNLLHNGVSTAVVAPVAVGATTEIIRLYGASTGASAIPGWAASSTESFQAVQMETLDRVLAGERTTRELGGTLIKVDVEGLEFAVASGAEDTIREVRPTWIIEICLNELHPDGTNEHFQSTFEFFWDRDYEARFATPGGESISRSQVEQWVELNSWRPPTNNILFSPVI